MEIKAEKLPQQHSTVYRGIPVVIEWPKGSTRTGKDKEGKSWRRDMKADYGYINDGSTAVGDHEPLDVYIGPDVDSDKAYLITQLTDDGEFDEYKMILGTSNLEEAEALYLSHYPDDWEDTRVGEVEEVPFDSLLNAVEEHQESKTAGFYDKSTPRSKASFIDGDGWVLPDGRFLPNEKKTHINNLRISLGVDWGYADAFEHGYIRVSHHTTWGQIESPFPLDQSYDKIISICKRMNLYDIDVKTGEGETFLKMKWDGKNLNRERQRMYAGTDAQSFYQRQRRPAALDNYIWISTTGGDEVMRGHGNEHWKFINDPHLAITKNDYDHSPRGYAEVKNDSKIVILSVTPANPNYAFIPESIVKLFQKKFPGYKIYKNTNIYSDTGKSPASSYQNALNSMNRY